MAIQSKWLATIILDCPVELEEEKLRIKPVNKEALTELFKELEFRAIAKKVLGEDIGGQEKLTETKSQKPAVQDLFSNPDLFSAQQDNLTTEETVSNFKTIHDVAHHYLFCFIKYYF